MEYAQNRRAQFDYDIIETYEAGIVLRGYEVKAIKNGRVNLSGSYVIIRDNEAWLLNADIPPYQPLNAPEDYDSKQTRRLLLKKSEIKSLIGRVAEKGLTLIPLKMYSKNRRIKLAIGLGKSRKKTDKRDVLKKRDIEKELRRTL